MTVETQNDLQHLSRRGRAALVASALTRVAPLVDELQHVWPALSIPTAKIIEQYVRTAVGLPVERLAWALNDERSPPPESISDLIESSLEIFALATEGAPTVQSSRCQETLLAIEELLEALDNGAGADPSAETIVGLDEGTPQIVISERRKRGSELDKIFARPDEALSTLLPSMIKESEQVGLGYLGILKRVVTASLTESTRTGSERNRPGQLLQTLKGFSKRDWEAVESCASQVDRPRALAAMRDALKVAGIDKSHDLLLEITSKLGLIERGPSWDIASRALLGAAAWDELDAATRDRLMQCLSDNNHVKQLLETW